MSMDVATAAVLLAYGLLVLASGSCLLLAFKGRRK